MKRLGSAGYLFLIILLAITLRFLWLDKVPNAMGGDELDYFLVGKAISLTGQDITGAWSPISLLSFKPPPGQWLKGELPYLIAALFTGPNDFSLFRAKLPYVFCSILTVLLIYLITKNLIDTRVAIIAGFLAAINPWFIYFGRTAYEATLVNLLYLCAIYILLIGKGWKILLALPFLYLGFYSYIATKLIFLPLTFLVAFYAYWFINKKRFLGQYLLLCFASICLVVFFAFSLRQMSGGSRLAEVLTPASPEIIQQVDYIRKVSIKTPLTNLFENKLSVFLRVIINNFLKILSTENLFLYGDNFVSIYRHGPFYYLDAVFLLLGFIILFIRKNKNIFFFLMALVIIGTLPQVFHTSDVNMASHIAFIFPFLIIFIAAGIFGFIKIIQRKYYFYISASIIVILYILLLLNFLNIYFFQHSLQGNFDFSVRLLSKYLSLEEKRSDEGFVFIITNGPPDYFRKYLFYTNSYNKNTALQIRQIFKEGKTEFGKVKFISCKSPFELDQKANIIIYNSGCGDNIKNLKHLSISRLADGGETYKIYNDALCGEFDLKRYPGGISLSDFEVESLSKKQFCETFVSLIE